MATETERQLYGDTPRAPSSHVAGAMRPESQQYIESLFAGGIQPGSSPAPTLGRRMRQDSHDYITSLFDPDFEYAPPTRPTTQPVEEPEERGPLGTAWDSFVTGVGEGNTKMVASTIKAFGNTFGNDTIRTFGEDLGLWAEDISDRAPPEVQDFRDIDSVRDFFEWAAGGVGQGIASMAPILGGVGAGAAAGSFIPGVGTTIGGIAGGLAAGFTLNAGEAADQFTAELQTAGDPDAERKGAEAGLIMGVPLAALDYLGTVFAAGAAKVPFMQAKQEVKRGVMRYLARVGTGAAKGYTSEGLTEFAQSLTREVTAQHLSGIEDSDRAMRALNEGMLGGFGGAAFGTAGAALPRGPGGQEQLAQATREAMDEARPEGTEAEQDALRVEAEGLSIRTDSPEVAAAARAADAARPTEAPTGTEREVEGELVEPEQRGPRTRTVQEVDDYGDVTEVEVTEFGTPTTETDPTTGETVARHPADIAEDDGAVVEDLAETDPSQLPESPDQRAQRVEEQRKADEKAAKEREDERQRAVVEGQKVAEEQRKEREKAAAEEEKRQQEVAREQERRQKEARAAQEQRQKDEDATRAQREKDEAAAEKQRVDDLATDEQIKRTDERLVEAVGEGAAKNVRKKAKADARGDKAAEARLLEERTKGLEQTRKITDQKAEEAEARKQREQADAAKRIEPAKDTAQPIKPTKKERTQARRAKKRARRETLTRAQVERRTAAKALRAIERGERIRAGKETPYRERTPPGEEQRRETSAPTVLPTREVLAETKHELGERRAKAKKAHKREVAREQDTAPRAAETVAAVPPERATGPGGVLQRMIFDEVREREEQATLVSLGDMDRTAFDRATAGTTTQEAREGDTFSALNPVEASRMMDEVVAETDQATADATRERIDREAQRQGRRSPFEAAFDRVMGLYRQAQRGGVRRRALDAMVGRVLDGKTIEGGGLPELREALVALRAEYDKAATEQATRDVLKGRAGGGELVQRQQRVTELAKQHKDLTAVMLSKATARQRETIEEAQDAADVARRKVSPLRKTLEKRQDELTSAKQKAAKDRVERARRHGRAAPKDPRATKAEQTAQERLDRAKDRLRLAEEASERAQNAVADAESKVATTLDAEGQAAFTERQTVGKDLAKARGALRKARQAQQDRRDAAQEQAARVKAERDLKLAEKTERLDEQYDSFAESAKDFDKRARTARRVVEKVRGELRVALAGKPETVRRDTLGEREGGDIAPFVKEGVQAPGMERTLEAVPGVPKEDLPVLRRAMRLVDTAGFSAMLDEAREMLKLQGFPSDSASVLAAALTQTETATDGTLHLTTETATRNAARLIGQLARATERVRANERQAAQFAQSADAVRYRRAREGEHRMANQKQRVAVWNKVKSVAQRMAPDLKLEQADGVDSHFDAVANTAAIAVTNETTWWNLGHETMEYLLAFVRGADLKFVEGRIDGWMTKYDIANRYADKSKAQQRNEAISEAFGEWMSTRMGEQGRVAQIFQSLYKMLRDLRRVLWDSGYRRAEDVFHDIYMGRYGEQVLAGDPKDFAARLDAQKGNDSASSFAEVLGRWVDVARKYTVNENYFLDAKKRGALINKLRIRRGVYNLAAMRIKADWMKVLGGLNRFQYVTLSQFIAFKDLEWTRTQKGPDGKPMKIPFAVDPASFDATLAVLQRRMDADPELQRRYELHVASRNALTQRQVKAGVLTKEQSENPHYYHHQVLEYQRALNAEDPNALALRKELQKSHQFERKGSQLPINLDYMQAEAAWRVKAEADIASETLLSWLKNESGLNIAVAAKAWANAYNVESLKAYFGDSDALATAKTDLEGVERDAAAIAEFKRNQRAIARGFGWLRDALGGLPKSRVPPMFHEAYDSLLAGKKKGETEGQREDRTWGLISWLMSNETGVDVDPDTGRPVGERNEWTRAAMSLAAKVRYKRDLTKKMLGDLYLPPEVDQLVGGVGHEDSPLRARLDKEPRLAELKEMTEGYAAWNDNQGLFRYTAQTLPEHTMNKLMELAEGDLAGALKDVPGVQAALKANPGLDLNSLKDSLPETMQAALKDMLSEVRSVSAAASSRPNMILPVDVAQALSDTKAVDLTNLNSTNGWVRALRAWKVAMLFTPWRFGGYSLTNITGDFDAYISAMPKLLGGGASQDVKRAALELWGVMMRGEEPKTAEFKFAMEHALFDGTMTMAEITSVMNYSLDVSSGWQSALDDAGGDPGKVPKKVWRAYWKNIYAANNWRESIARYALFLQWDKAIARAREELGPDATVEEVQTRAGGFGAANRYRALDIVDDRERAAYIANESMIDYQAASQTGNALRRYVIPFWSWRGGQLKRYHNLMRNVVMDTSFALKQGDTKGAAGIVAKRSALATMTAGRVAAGLSVKMALYTVAFESFNAAMLARGECEDVELPPRPMLVLWCDKDSGSLITMKAPGALRDFFDFFGASDLAVTMQAMIQGRADFTEAATTVAHAVVANVAGGTTPFIKAPLEMAEGKVRFPDPLNPRPITDRWEHAFQQIGVDFGYRAMFKIPSTTAHEDPALTWVDSMFGRQLFQQRDVEQRAWQSVRSKGYDFAKAYGLPRPGAAELTERSKAARYWRQAKGLGLPSYEKKYLETARLAWIDDVRKGLFKGKFSTYIRNVLKSQHPLAMLPDKRMKALFLRSLSPSERAQLTMAMRWYGKTYGGL